MAGEGGNRYGMRAGRRSRMVWDEYKYLQVPIVILRHEEERYLRE